MSEAGPWTSFTLIGDDVPMSKKIDAALKDLKKALTKHASVVGGSTVSLKKAQRATAKVTAAATAYAEAVHSKSGMGNPFDDVLQPGLEKSTLESLAAERDAIAKSLTGPIPIQSAAKPATVKPATTKPATTKPAAVKAATTKAAVKPAAVKPAASKGA